MRVGFDATTLRPGGKGIARVQGELLQAVAAERLADDLTVFVPDDVELDPLVFPQAPGWRYVAVPTRPLLRWEQVGLPRAARREGLDVVVTLSERAALWGPPNVVYVFEHPRRRARRASETGVPLRQRLVDLLTLALFAPAMRRAGTVLTGSASTAADLAGIRSDARVAYAGVSSAFTPADREQRHLLVLASADPRENGQVALHAYARLVDPPPLVVAGDAPEELRRLAADLGIADRVSWPGFVEDGELVELYREAIAYVDPSLYEGFGLQAAEALACGTPVISSNTTSLPEIVGDAGILLDPSDVEGFAEAMQLLSTDPELRAALSARAAQRRFSWADTARAVFGAAEALSGRGARGADSPPGRAG